MPENRILARLPSAEGAQLSPHLRPIRFEPGMVLYEAGAGIEYSYFPLHGTLSAVVVMLDGRMIEVATIGNEGAVGLPTIGLDRKSLHRVIVQIPGNGLRIETRILDRECRSSKTLQRMILTYQDAFLFQVSQSVACNGLHSLRERCCRWLLMSHDRSNGDEIKLTHEFLAVMLGVRRPSVSEVLQELQESGLLSYNRGSITLLERQGVEAASCECYRVVADRYAKQIP